jgi:hypothetical protein
MVYRSPLRRQILLRQCCGSGRKIFSSDGDGEREWDDGKFDVEAVSDCVFEYGAGGPVTETGSATGSASPENTGAAGKINAGLGVGMVAGFAGLLAL